MFRLLLGFSDRATAALLGAAVFGFSAVHTEAIATIVGRAGLLACGFGAAARLVADLSRFSGCPDKFAFDRLGAPYEEGGSWEGGGASEEGTAACFPWQARGWPTCASQRAAISAVPYAVQELNKCTPGETETEHGIRPKSQVQLW